MSLAISPITPVSYIRPVDRNVTHPRAKACSYRLVFAAGKQREPEEFSAVSPEAALHAISEQYGLPYPLSVVLFYERGFIRVEQVLPGKNRTIFPLLS